MSCTISVIVPVYNSEKYLKKCINSILSQDYKDFELLLVNDGSSDKSYDICKSYKDKRIRCFNQKNKGVSSARNLGISNSKGEYITFIDSDDFISSNHLLTMLKSAERFKADISICSFESVDANGNKCNQYSSEWAGDKVVYGDKASDIIIKKILYNQGGRQALMSPYCKLYRSSIIKENGIRFEEKLPIGEDVIFNLQYARFIKSFCYKKKKTYYRTLRKGSAVMKQRKRVFYELKCLFESYNQIKKSLDYTPSSEKMFFFNKLNDSLGLYVFRGKNVFASVKRVKEFYAFLNSDSFLPVWRNITFEDFDNNKEKIKFAIIKYYLVYIWAVYKHIKR